MCIRTVWRRSLHWLRTVDTGCCYSSWHQRKSTLVDRQRYTEASRLDSATGVAGLRPNKLQYSRLSPLQWREKNSFGCRCGWRSAQTWNGESILLESLPSTSSRSKVNSSLNCSISDHLLFIFYITFTVNSNLCSKEKAKLHHSNQSYKLTMDHC